MWLTAARSMRFNHRELALYAAGRSGKADKEGALLMKECDGKSRKRDSRSII